MKKLLPLALIAVTAALFTSCKKDYTCKCYYTPAASSTPTILTSFNIHDTRDNAKSNCAGFTAGYATLPHVNCDIQ
jgi:hypothetical protein